MKGPEMSIGTEFCKKSLTCMASCREFMDTCALEGLLGSASVVVIVDSQYHNGWRNYGTLENFLVLNLKADTNRKNILW